MQLTILLILGAWLIAHAVVALVGEVKKDQEAMTTTAAANYYLARHMATKHAKHQNDGQADRRGSVTPEPPKTL